MKTVSTQKMRELDRRTIRDYGIPGETLMERAGLGVADVVDYVAQALAGIERGSTLELHGWTSPGR